MRKQLILLIFLCCGRLANTQDSVPKMKSFEIAFGQSYHYTGDIPGIALSFAHNYYFTPRLSVSNGVMTTIHWEQDLPYLSLNGQPPPYNRLIRIMKTGVQYDPFIRYSFLTLHRHQLMIFAGGVARFEARSSVSYHFLEEPERYPEPFYVFFNERTKQTGFTVGYIFGAQYQYSGRKMDLGLRAGVQYDSVGDGLSLLQVLVGRKYRKLKLL